MRPSLAGLVGTLHVDDITFTPNQDSDEGFPDCDQDTWHRAPSAMSRSCPVTSLAPTPGEIRALEVIATIVGGDIAYCSDPVVCAPD